MTLTFETSENNDFVIGADGNLSLVNGIDAVSFVCRSQALVEKGEVEFDVDQGIPRFDAVWNGVPNIPRFDAVLRQTILNVSGVQSIESLTISTVNNVLSYAATIKTNFGTLTI